MLHNISVEDINPKGKKKDALEAERRKYMLNEEQKKAVMSTSKRILVLAGAGTGKTTVIANRVQYLASKRVDPGSIYCISFTRYAAGEMQHRINVRKEYKDRIFINTFHKFCIELLKEYKKCDYKIAGDGIKKKLRKSNSIKVNVSEKKLDKAIKNWVNDSDRKIALAMQEYVNDLEKLKLLDIDIVLYQFLELLKEPAILEDVRKRIKHLIIDEFQDTNLIQNKILEKISPENIFVVGDDFQGIYAFNGARIENILEFEKKYDAEVIKLTKNYRSTKQIVQAANNLISYNPKQSKKTLEACNEGAEIDIIQSANELEEYYRIMAQIDESKKTAILCRTNREIEQIITVLERNSYEYETSLKVTDKDCEKVVSLLEFIYNPININTEEVIEISTEIKLVALNEKISYWEAYKLYNANKEDKYVELVNMANESLNKVVDFIEKNFFQISERFKEDIKKFKNIKEFIETRSIENIQDRLNNSQKNLFVVTIHASKGLEWENVIVPNCNTGNIPKTSRNAVTDEERRLFYVAITRAKERLTLFYIDNKRSIFLNEIKRQKF